MFTIGLDLRGTEPGFKSHFGRGTGRYAAEVTRALLELSDQSIQFVPLNTEKLLFPSWERLMLKLTPIGKVTLETQLLLPSRLGKLGLDLVHFFSHGDATPRSPVPYVVTVLDLIPLRFPELYKADKPSWRFHFARWLELQAIKSARGILAISECTKRDIVELLGVPADRIRVTPLGVDSRFVPLERGGGWVEGAELRGMRMARRQQLGLPTDRPILLYVGGIDPRKNIPFLIQVQNELVQSAHAKGTQPPLLCMVGRYESERTYPALLESIKGYEIENDLRLLGFLSDEDLLSMYHVADVVLFPSLYEGFGLPILEAMACGVPVVAGNNSSLPEVVGDAGPLYPDGDLTSWVNGVQELLTSEREQDRLRRAGRERAAGFTWLRTAQDTLEAYRYFAALPNSSEPAAPDGTDASWVVGERH